MAFGSMGRSYTENDNPYAQTFQQQTANGLGLGFGSIGGPASTTFMNPVQANSIGGGPETGSLSGANGSNGTASYAPTWAGSGVLTNSALIGGNAGWMDGNGYLYAGNYRPDLGFSNEFVRYQDTPFLRQALSNNKASLLNGTAYDVLDANGNVIRSDVWKNLKDNASTQMWDGLVTAAVGGLFGAGALGYLGGAPAAEAAGAGGITGFGDAGTMYAGSTAADAATLGGGASVYGGQALGGLGAGTAAMGAGGAGGAAGVAPPANPYYGAATSGTGGSSALGSLGNIMNGTGSASDWLGLATTALGALGGSQGQNASTSSSRSMDPRMEALFYNGLAPTAQGLLASTTPQAQVAGSQLMSRGAGLLGQSAPDTAQNPYLKSIADDMQRRTADLLGQNNLAIQGNSVATGGLGGSRQGVAQGVAASRAADTLQGQIAGLYGNAYEGDQNRLRQDWTLGSGMLSQGVSLPFAPALNTASIYGPFTGFGTTTNSAQSGGGWMGALGGALGAAQYGHNAGWF